MSKVIVKTIKIEAYTAPTNQPTCAISIPDLMCPFLQTQRMGTEDICALETEYWQGRTITLEKWPTGYLCPGESCIVWSQEEINGGATQPIDTKQTTFKT